MSKVASKAPEPNSPGAGSEQQSLVFPNQNVNLNTSKSRQAVVPDVSRLMGVSVNISLNYNDGRHVNASVNVSGDDARHMTQELYPVLDCVIAQVRAAAVAQASL